MKACTLMIGLLVLSCWTSSAVAAQFGYRGDDGRSGYDGRDGSDGRNFTVFADGRGGSLDARGDRGQRGSDGDSGYAASSCHQPCEAYSVYGADGGSGGRGGDGGRGGNGGDFTVYYDQEENLSLMYLYGGPGAGGSAGYGGRGADGCRCQVYSWEIDGQTYHCRDGNYGQSGGSGSRGRSGSWGTLKLIPQLAPLPVEAPRVSTTVSEAMGQTQYLSQHLWDTRSNPRALFGRGSELPDSYQHYRSTANVEVNSTWTASRDASEFADANLTFSLSEGVLSVNTGDDVWLDHDTVVDRDGVAYMEISHGIYVNEVRSLRFRGFSGSGRQLSATFEDQSGHTDDINTTYYVKYYTRGLVFKRLRFQGNVPEELISFDGDRMTLRLGGLNIPSGYLESGDRINVEFWAKRASGRRDLTLSYSYNHRIGR